MLAMPSRRASGRLGWIGSAILLASCGARTDLDETQSNGAGGAPEPGTSSGSTSTTTHASTSTGTGGMTSVTCEPPLVPFSLVLPESGAVTEPASVAAADGTLYLLASYADHPDLGPDVTTDPGERGVLLARVDPCGNVLWVRPFPGSAQATIEGGAIAAELVVFGGHLTGTLDFGTGPVVAEGEPAGFVVAFDGAGDAVWTRSFSSAGGAPDEVRVRALAADHDAVYAAGGFEGAVDFGDATRTAIGDTDMFLARLSPTSGATLWSRSLGSAAYEEALAVAVTSSGAICLGSGGFGMFAWPNGVGSTAAITRLDRESGSPVSAIETKDAAVTAMTSIGDDCVAVGTYQGSLHLGPVSLPTAIDGSNGFATRVDPDSSPIWARPFGPDNGDLDATAVGGRVFVAGSVNGAWNFEEGTVLGDPLSKENATILVGLDVGSGAFVSGRAFDGASTQSVRAIHPRDGALLVTGVVAGHGLDLGQGPLTTAASESVFVARLAWESTPPSE